MQFFCELRLMIFGIMNSLKSLLWCSILLVLMTFIFAVVFTQSVADELVKGENASKFQGFQRLGLSMFSLFQCISSGRDWVELARPLMDIGPFLSIVFSVYITFAVFCVLNVVTGVFVDNATRHQLDKVRVIMDELTSRKKCYNELQELFRQADEDDSGEVTWPEFEALAKNIRVQTILHQVGLVID